MNQAISPRDLGLPYLDWHPFQLQTILKAVSAFSSGKRYVLIEGPPGTGKTGTAIAIARLMEYETAYLTSTKDLQRQYEQTSKSPRVIGRPNFRCLIKPEVSASDGQCVSGEKCQYAGLNGRGGCAFFDQLRNGMASPEVSLNYAMALRSMNYPKYFIDRDLLVCDEAHLLKSELESFISLEVSYSTLQKFGLLPRGAEGFSVAEWVWWAAEAGLPEVATLIRGYREEIAQADQEDQWVIQDPKKLSSLTGIQRTLKELVAKAETGGWVLQKTGGQGRGSAGGSAGGVEFLPVWVTPHVQSALLRHAEKFLFLSATIGDPATFCELFSLDPKDVYVIRCPSIFDVVRRPIYYTPVVRVSGADVEESAKKLAPVLDALIEGYQSKGLIHTVSYRLARAVERRLSVKSRARLLLPQANRREQALEEFRQSEEPLVLMSPSMTTGVDLPFDLCRWQAILKLPFADQTSPVVKEQMKSALGKRLQMQATAQTLCQAYGRIMRDEADWGVTHLLDSNWQWFRFAAKQYLAPWFTEAIVR